MERERRERAPARGGRSFGGDGGETAGLRLSVLATPEEQLAHARESRRAVGTAPPHERAGQLRALAAPRRELAGARARCRASSRGCCRPRAKPSLASSCAELSLRGLLLLSSSRTLLSKSWRGARPILLAHAGGCSRGSSLTAGRCPTPTLTSWRPPCDGKRPSCGRRGVAQIGASPQSAHRFLPDSRPAGRPPLRAGESPRAAQRAHEPARRQLKPFHCSIIGQLVSLVAPRRGTTREEATRPHHFAFAQQQAKNSEQPRRL